MKRKCKYCEKVDDEIFFVLNQNCCTDCKNIRTSYVKDGLTQLQSNFKLEYIYKYGKVKYYNILYVSRIFMSELKKQNAENLTGDELVNFIKNGALGFTDSQNKLILDEILELDEKLLRI